MAIECTRCGRQYDVTLFEFGRTVSCECGAIVTLESGHRRSTEPRLTTRLLLIRQGRPDEDRAQTDDPDLPTDPRALSEGGLFQARALAEKLRNETIAAIYSSDEKHAVQTARIVNEEHHLMIQTCPELRDTAAHASADREPATELMAVPRSETEPELRQRVSEVVERAAVENWGKTAAIVASEDVRLAFLAHVLGREPRNEERDEVHSRSILVVRRRPDGWHWVR